MRYFFLASLVISAISFGECKLTRPVRGAGEKLLKSPVTLQNMLLSETPKFTRPKNFVLGTDAVVLELFDIQHGNQPMGYLGGRFAVAGKLESVGFSSNYLGSFSVTGSTTSYDGVTTYETKNSFRPFGAQHAPGMATTELTVKVFKGDITAIQLKHPLFKVWKSTSSADYVAFTGEHQTLCVTHADLKN